MTGLFFGLAGITEKQLAGSRYSRKENKGSLLSLEELKRKVD